MGASNPDMEQLAEELGDLSIANLFARELTGDGMFAQAFRHISFSIPANPKALENIQAFRQAFTTGN